jgi:hypothetical protein
MKEITGSGIFVANREDETTEDGSANPSANKTGIRMYQVLFLYEKTDTFTNRIDNVHTFAMDLC